MRLAGTVNAKTGAYARVMEADFALPRTRSSLVGDLSDPAVTGPPKGRTQRAEP